MDITRGIARNVAASTIDAFPDEVVAYAKTLTMSAFGAMVAGGTCTGSDIVTRYVKRAGGTPEATVFGEDVRLPVEMAAFANATYAHATEYEDDSFPEAVSSYTIVPVAVALGEQLGSSGRDVLAAFVAGYETQARIGLACREARRLGYMVLSLAGSIGCAATAARLFGLDAERTANALSIAASQASGVGYQTGTMAHIVEMGFSARNGLTAALLARDGFTGQPDVLEAPRGLFAMITAGKIEAPERILADWGRPYRILEVGIKEFPCCYHLQRIIETTMELRSEGIAAADVERVEVEVNAFFPTVVQHLEPHDELQAQFSLPHAVAAAFLDPRVLPASFARERIEDPAVRDFRSRVAMVVREDWGWAPTGWTPRLTYRLRDGRVIVREPPGSRGQPPNLLSFDEAIPKYRGCVEGRIAEESIVESLAILRDLERCADVSALARAVSRPGFR
ncbi:hypothetical protein VY88_20155 [Azospirillum thiophilum]|uniref:MmgE/PrpD family protein n=1 Tax=Azospirillum thiophilum TaxID=528244 RepID=A0AAC8W3D9_9PROT|nr:MmgE/PrpD family protein [Azospirillum thiophilum]ALG74358.1 hypothetical protein AL072_25815 [Azospirillum thiophilum]KJR63774.1 hypothetical protein VY88_20155 [Azospirillum thiophilum]